MKFTRGLDYAGIVGASERVAWTVDGVFRGRGIDPAKPIVPASWVGTDALAFLGAQEQLVLNHCRAFSYVHLLGNFEEFIPLHLTDGVPAAWQGDRAQLRALLRFGEEELKHQELFRRAEAVLEACCGHPFGRHFDAGKVRVTAFTNAILEFPVLPRFLILLALEWGTQRHYVDSIRDLTDQRGAALYVDVLKAHWLEEAQHAKTDALEVARLARGMSADELRESFEGVAKLGALVDRAFAGQVNEEIDTVRQVTGRSFSADESAALRDTLHRSMSASIAGVALTHPGFVRVACELSPDGAAALGLVAAPR
jgi:hypothetical protein